MENTIQVTAAGPFLRADSHVLGIQGECNSKRIRLTLTGSWATSLANTVFFDDADGAEAVRIVLLSFDPSLGGNMIAQGVYEFGVPAEAVRSPGRVTMTVRAYDEDGKAVRKAQKAFTVLENHTNYPDPSDPTPSLAEQLQRSIASMAVTVAEAIKNIQHEPVKINDGDKHWYVWNPKTGEYEDTGVSAVYYSDALKLITGSIDGKYLADNAVETRALADGAVTTPKLAGGAVTTEKLANDSVTYDKLATDSVDAGILRKDAVTTSRLKDGAVTNDKVRDGSLNLCKLAFTLAEAASCTLTVENYYGNNEISSTQGNEKTTVRLFSLTVAGGATWQSSENAAMQLPAGQYLIWAEAKLNSTDVNFAISVCLPVSALGDINTIAIGYCTKDAKINQQISTAKRVTNISAGDTLSVVVQNRERYANVDEEQGSVELRDIQLYAVRLGEVSSDN